MTKFRPVCRAGARLVRSAAVPQTVGHLRTPGLRIGLRGARVVNTGSQGRIQPIHLRVRPRAAVYSRCECPKVLQRPFSEGLLCGAFYGLHL